MPSPISTQPWLLQWTEAFSVGIAEVDADHQRFMMLVNELNDAISQRRDSNQITLCVQAIIVDAEAHFNHEQDLFRASGYADAEAHEQRHKETMRELHSVMAVFNRNATEYGWIAAGLRAKQILVEHLISESEQYRR